MSKTALSTGAFAERMLVLLPRLMRASWQADRAILALREITMAQLWALTCLAQGPGLTMRQLALQVSLSNSTTTGLADQLVARGLVRRQRSREDRRVVQVGLTRRGVELMERVTQNKKRMLIEGFGRLSAAERAMYLGILEKVLAGLPGEGAAPRRAGGAR